MIQGNTYTLYVQATLYNVRELRLAKGSTVSFRLRRATSPNERSLSPPPFTATLRSNDRNIGDTVTLFNRGNSFFLSNSGKWTKDMDKNAFNEPELVDDRDYAYLVKIKSLRPFSSADSDTFVPFIEVECQGQIEPYSFNIFDCDFSVTTKGGKVFSFINLEDGGNWSDFDERMGVSAIADLKAIWVNETK